MSEFQTPLLKWVGGKTQLMGEIMSRVPKKIDRYYEPFVGGGSVLLAMLSTRTITGDVVASDANPNLIRFYRDVQSRPDELWHAIQRHLSNYDSCNVFNGERKPDSESDAMVSKESYYYWMRKVFNDESTVGVEKSALFILLNKLGFRGLYREGPNGFNVPFGNYNTTPTVITRESLNRVSLLIQRVQFRVCDYRDVGVELRKGDFLYLDPPYVPESATSFTEYVKGEFDHGAFLKWTLDIGNRGVNVIMSNSNTALVTDAFEGAKGFTIDRVDARRSIHSKDPSAKTKEVIVWIIRGP